MDLIENPELKSMYHKCKYRVKLWEHDFKKQHGRLPSKLDIREAEREVRLAYKTYFNLKSAAIERSFLDIDGFQSDDDEVFEVRRTESENQIENERRHEGDIAEEIWGKHLNNKVEEDIKTNEPKNNINISFSQKLFNGSKFSKRNPRKSLSQQNRKNRASINETLSQIQDDASISSSQEFFESFVTQNPPNFRTITAKHEMQPLDLIQSVLNNEYKVRSSLDAGWLDRVVNNTGVEKSVEYNDVNFDLSQKCTQALERSKSENYHDDSDDVIANSEDESSDLGVKHISKKRKMDLSRSVSCPGMSSIANDNGEVNKSEDVNLKKLEGIESNVENADNKIANLELNKGDIIKEINEASIKNKKSPKISKRTKTAKNKPKTEVKQKRNPIAKKQPTRAKKPVVLKEDSDSETSDYIPNDKDFIPDDKNDEAISIKSSKKSFTKNNGAKDGPADDEKYELEYSVKSRILTVPRIRKVRKIATKQKVKDEEVSEEEKTVENLPKTKQSIAREKLEKKIASGGLNENFVTINMKKKVYVRGKKGLNFNKYKKQQWKNKKKALSGPDMDMGGCDGGMLTCFNCGDVGHFARHCPKRKGDKLLPLEVVEGEGEEESLIPTLEEAEKMAEESALAVRKSNKKLINKGIGETVELDKDQTEELIADSQEDDDGDSDDDLLLAETLKMEEIVAKLDMQAYVDSTTFVKPFYQLKEDGTIMDTPKEIFETLKQFGYSNFRPGQERAVMRILSGQSTLVTLSTGSGKSLCYQLPAYLYSKREPCIALVISPLVSLMEDQVTGLPSFLKAACLHTNQTKTQREKVMELVLSAALSILLVSPEAVAAGERSTGFGSLLRKLPPISFACIDEAHCVSQWSHNFRPSYLMICRILRERLGVNIILGLTATATRSTANNIVEHLQIPDGVEGIISDTPLPSNLHLTVSKDGNRDNALLSLLLSERFAQCKSVIVYCTRREECERVAGFLRMTLKEEGKRGSAAGNGRKRKRMSDDAEPYHAGLSASRRKAIQKSFMSGELRIVVATVAFGMGINKSDIRSVIHYNMPSSFESYVQEIGRAGRDGLPAHCHLFLDAQGNDENELRRHIHSNSIDRHVIRKLLQKIFVPCSCKGTCPKHEVAFSIQATVQSLDVPEENIATLLCYLELHERRFVQVLSPAYVTCKIISYKGAAEIRRAAKDCPPLAMALALYGCMENDGNIFEFPIVDVASAMGWDSGICKHKLKNLQWTSVNGAPKRSSLTVEFSNLGFRLLAPGNLSGDQLDDTLDHLYKRVVDQEKMCLMQLRALHTTLTSFATRTYKDCLTTTTNEDLLKEKIRDYFNRANPLAGYEEDKIKPVIEENIVKDTRQLIVMYKDNVFTGRAVARIFHGIQSPNYPAVIWGRCRFWRSHLHDDFHEICRIATREILKMR